ncbi:MAG: DUF72 domain-containing protein [Victivallales bacterium]|nr:DUF72 domain-containing protein [Victivallales bacterium]
MKTQPDLFSFPQDQSPEDRLKLSVPEPLRPFLRLGTCSWKYDSWKGLLYDAARKYRAADYLADYAKHLTTVEIDQWFWSLFPTGITLPAPDTVRQYANSVPDDFRFTVKAPNAITLTHYYGKQPARFAAFANRPNEQFLDLDLLNRFLERLSPMGSKLGPIMFQFEYLNRQKMPSLAAFIGRLDRFLSGAPKGFQYAIEMRNPNWLSPELFDLLAKHGAGYVFLEGYYMPHIGEVWDRLHPTTADFAVIRLHGPDRSKIEGMSGEQWDRVLDPHPEGLQAAATIIRANAARRAFTFVNVNNHFEGSAPKSIEMLLEAMRSGNDATV